MTKVTIAIPNFNGEKLLEKNLPNILAAGADEVLIIDDFSKDQSILMIRKNFPKVKLLINQKNYGFIVSVNKLFKEAIGDIVVLLNNDVFVEKDFLKPLLKHFQDKDVFAVNCHEKGEGPSITFWKDGYFQFDRGIEKNELQESGWASGGSAAFSKKIWNELKGFDKLYAPFYWEDLDISYRAKQSGYKILWEPASCVYHQHETTISKSFNKRYVDWIKQRNQLLFIWKNITNKNLLKDHKNHLIKRLINLNELGYWIPFIWAVWRKRMIKS